MKIIVESTSGKKQTIKSKSSLKLKKYVSENFSKIKSYKIMEDDLDKTIGNEIAKKFKGATVLSSTPEQAKQYKEDMKNINSFSEQQQFDMIDEHGIHVMKYIKPISDDLLLKVLKTYNKNNTYISLAIKFYVENNRKNPPEEFLLLAAKTTPTFSECLLKGVPISVQKALAKDSAYWFSQYKYADKDLLASVTKK